MAGPLTDDELSALRAFSAPTICNAIEKFGVRPRTEGFTNPTIVCHFPGLGRMAGYAMTAKMRARRPPEKEVSFDEISSPACTRPSALLAP